MRGDGKKRERESVRRCGSEERGVACMFCSPIGRRGLRKLLVCPFDPLLLVSVPLDTAAVFGVFLPALRLSRIEAKEEKQKRERKETWTDERREWRHTGAGEEEEAASRSVRVYLLFSLF
mmetsp:Transcript_36341/g.71522  ORF Transcript_36341/g.71522 Transcript_36341/m.71522 type:complete len:120 (+) Transcript_36341:229-588(+)